MKHISIYAVMLLVLILGITGCTMTKSNLPQTSPAEQPTLKLKIEGVDTVKADTSEMAERGIALEESRLALDREKWEYEKKQAEIKELKSKLSVFCNIDNPIPVFDLYSSISMLDWKNMQKDFNLLWNLGYKKIIVRFFSGGGSAFAGLGIADLISEWVTRGMDIEGQAYGLIASATVPIFAACKTRQAGTSTLFMVHEAAAFKFFTLEKHSDISAQERMFNLMLDKYVGILEKRSNKKTDFWKTLIRETTWFSADQAKEWGLVDIVE